MRLGLAFRVFFALLFGKPLPEELVEIARAQLPPTLPPPPPQVATDVADTQPPPPRPPPQKDDPERLNSAAVQVLAVLQAEGRLLDFLSEDIDSYSDADIGAAVRDLHRGLKKALVDHFPIEHVRPEDEDSTITIPAGFDPSQVRLVGNVVGEPPFSGTLKHRGWRVRAVRLPRIPDGDAGKIAAPAEVEL